MIRRLAAYIFAIGLLPLGCESATEAVPDRLSGAYTLATIDSRPIANVSVHYTSNGQQYRSLIAGDTVAVLGDTVIERHIVFRTTKVGSDRDSTWTEEAHECGQLTQEGTTPEILWRPGQCSQPRGFQFTREALVLRRGGFARSGYPWEDGLQSQRAVEWWYAPVR